MKLLVRCLVTTAAIAVLPFSAHAQDVTAEPNYGTISLSAGFPDDPNITNVQAGGSVDASTISDGCVGFVSNAPDIRLNYDAGATSLFFSVASAFDTTLVINAPNGEWFCGDDTDGSVNPTVSFNTPQSGQYDIWVGTYANTEMQEASLWISEISGEEDGTDPRLSSDGTSSGVDTSAEPTYETISLAAGFTPDPYSLTLLAGGGNDATEFGSPCTGFVASRPDVRLNYEAGTLPLFIRSQSEADTTLAVNAPDGQWYCDDDGGAGVNAQVFLDAPQSGRYDIFVGVYGDSALESATLEISEIQLAE